MPLPVNKNPIEVVWMDERHGSGAEMMATRGISFDVGARVHYQGLTYVIRKCYPASYTAQYHLLERVI